VAGYNNNDEVQSVTGNCIFNKEMVTTVMTWVIMLPIEKDLQHPVYANKTTGQFAPE
jgi:hypothetical protein